MNIRAKIGIAAVAILLLLSAEMLFRSLLSTDSEPNDGAPPTVFVEGKRYWCRLDRTAPAPEDSQIAGRFTVLKPYNLVADADGETNVECCINQPYAFVDGELVVYAVGVSRSTPTGEIEKFDSWFYCEPY